MKKLTFLLAYIVLLASCQDDTTVEVQSKDELKYSAQEIDAFIQTSIDAGDLFDWSTATSEMIHSAAQLSDELIAIGYSSPGYEDVSKWVGQTDQMPSAVLEYRDQLIKDIVALERKHTNNPELTSADIVAYDLDDEIPTLALKVTTLQSIEAIREMEHIRYLEPMGYDPSHGDGYRQLKSDAGCSSAPNYGIPTADYVNTDSYNAKIPWNFFRHNITSAWRRADGSGVSICIIDSGASDYQDNLGSQFTSGNSGGRSINKYSTKYSGSWWWKTKDSPHDQCGHGTSMAGLAAAPWGSDGNALGVAYGANLVTVRAVEDVVISSSNEKNGVKDALKLAGNRADVKVISMSIGNVISSGTVKDGIYYAYNRGKMMMAAAGTSTTFTNWVGVIFPASMSETIAVTGIKDQKDYERCNTCHDGSKVEFTIAMQRSYDSERNSLSLATTGDQPQYISGSSCATATAAGIAALVYSTNQNMSRSQVHSRLKKASELYYNKSSKYGYGNINAEAAVRGQTY